VHKGDSVTITGFGVFEQRRRAARVARNPRTGETVKVKPTSVPAFRPGAQFKAVVFGRAASPPAGRTSVKRGVVASGWGQEGGKEVAGEEGREEGWRARLRPRKRLPRRLRPRRLQTKRAPAKKATKA